MFRSLAPALLAFLLLAAGACGDDAEFPAATTAAPATLAAAAPATTAVMAATEDMAMEESADAEDSMDEGGDGTAGASLAVLDRVDPADFGRKVIYRPRSPWRLPMWPLPRRRLWRSCRAWVGSCSAADPDQAGTAGGYNVQGSTR